MESLLGRLQGRRAALLVLGLGSLTVAVFMVALIGFFSLRGGSDGETDLAVGDEQEETTEDGGTTTDTSPTGDTVPGGDPNNPVTGPDGTTGPGGTGPGGTTQRTLPGGKPFVPEKTDPGEAPLPKGGNATGVTNTQIKYGVHAPITFNKAPVPLAGPVMRGIEIYVNDINAKGGINGRAIKFVPADDEFTVGGADRAADKLIDDEKVFFVAGTLGVDQIKVVADKANKSKVPYFAGGGHEPLFKQMNLFQILSSYDTHVQKLADYMAKDPMYKGKTIGTFTSDTPQIQPVIQVFKSALEKHGMTVKVNQNVQKPELQAAQGYQGIILAYKNAGVQVVVPLTDPINTSGLISQCGHGSANSCPWTYAFSNFAHEGETALTLFNDEWGRLKVRGLAGACYPNAGPVNDNPAKCASMKQAREQFEKAKGAGSWTRTVQDNWGASTGYNSAAGYQWTFFKEAMIDQGSEVTRERFIAATKRYNGYRDLITGPITYKGSPNLAHGAELMAVFEAQTGNKYKMISDGLVGGF